MGTITMDEGDEIVVLALRPWAATMVYHGVGVDGWRGSGGMRHNRLRGLPAWNKR
jgi:hypothetical protein